MIARRRLGRTEEQISQLCIGGIPLTNVDDATSDAIIHTALDAGINLLEMSHAYGNGVSERKFGRVLKTRRDECLVHSRAIVRTGEEMLASIDASLKNLQVDVIDIYGVHDINCEVGRAAGFLEEQIEALHRAKDAGKIRYLAVSGHREGDLVQALRTGAFDVVMVAVNPLDLDIAEAVLPVAQELDLGVIAMKPFAGGLFTERPDISLRYALAQAVSTVSAGVKSVAEMEEDIAVAQAYQALSPAELGSLLDEAAEATAALGKHICRQCGYCLRDDGCPVDIDIPRVFYIQRAAKRYFSPGWAKEAYDELEVLADECIECGACEERCPYDLPIREMLVEAHALLTS
jgi:predicted aldo/keto reductase-like oxidoreductase